MIREILVETLKKGDKFRYVHDWDFFGKPQYSDYILASDDAIIIKTSVIVPFGGDDGRCFMSQVGRKVEIYCE